MSCDPETRVKAKDLRKDKKYLEALPLFKELWENCDPKDKWDGWGYAYCLNKTRDYNTAYLLLKKVYEIDNTFEYVKGQFAWASYMANIKEYPDDESSDKLEDFVAEVISVTEGKEDELFRSQSIIKMMEHYSANGSWIKVVEWSKLVNPDLLSDKAFDGISSDGKKFRKPSDRESYYLKLTKALDKENKFEECIKECDNGLDSFPNEVWLKWHKGSALRKLKKYPESIALLEEVKTKKNDWFILKDLSAAYYGLNNNEKALEYFLEGSALSIRIPEPQYRWELYYVGSRILLKLGKTDLASQHIALVYKLREENNWGIQDFLQSDIDTYKISLEKSSSELFKELKEYWIKERSDSLPGFSGEIKNIISEGKAGFIKSVNGTDYYFNSRNFLDKKSSITIGLKVKFNIQKSFDKKKNCESKEAININIV